MSFSVNTNISALEFERLLYGDFGSRRRFVPVSSVRVGQSFEFFRWPWRDELCAFRREDGVFQIRSIFGDAARAALERLERAPDAEHRNMILDAVIDGAIV
jgi:hypothetical protein